MEFFVNSFFYNRNSFLKTMQAVIIITGKEVNNQFHSQFKIESSLKEGKINIICTNNESDFRKELKVDVIKEGSFCTNAQKIFELVKELYDDEIIFKVLDNQWLLLKNNKSSIKIPSYDKSKFPNIDLSFKENTFSLAAIELNEAFKKTTDFVSVEPIKINLQGIFIETNKESIRFVSSDSYRACEYFIKEKQIKNNKKIIISSSSFPIIGKYLENEKEEIIDVCIDDVFLQFQTKDSFFQTKLLNEEYPDMDDIFKFKEGDFVLKIGLKEFLKEIKILKVIVDEFSSTMKFVLSKNKLKIESEKMQTGESKHELDCVFEKESFKIGLNINYMIRALQNMETNTKELEIHFKGEDKFITIKDCDEKNYQIVMMPMRTSW